MVPGHLTPPPAPAPPRRALIALAALSLGLILAHNLPPVPSAALFSLSSLFCAIAALKPGRACRISLFIACTLTGAAWYTSRIHELAASSLTAHLQSEPQLDRTLLTVEALILDTPRTLTPADGRGALAAFAPSGPSTRFTADLLAVDAGGDASEPVAITGKLWVRIAEPLRAALQPGDRVRLTGTFQAIDGPVNPGQQDMRPWAAQEHFAGSLRVSSEALVEPLTTPPSLLQSTRAAYLRFRAALHARAAAILGTDGPAPTTPLASRGRALIAALLLGDKEPDLHDVRSAYTRLGLAHILAISGFHLVVMAGVALTLIRFTGDRGRVEPALVAALVALYLIIVPADAPIIRSGLMVLALLLADALGRRYDALNLLGWIAVALLVRRPLDLFTLGFQLSLGLTAVLIWLGRTSTGRLFGRPVLTDIPKPFSIPRWTAHKLQELFAMTLMCWAISIPTVAYTTGLLSPLTILATLLLLPPSVLILWFAYAALIVGILIPPIGIPAAAVLAHLGTWTVALAQWLDHLPGSGLRLPAVSLPWAILTTILLLYWFRRGHSRDWPLWGCTAALALWLGIDLWSAYARAGLPAGTALRIDTLAVGDGACHLIRAAPATNSSVGATHAESILWDCGSLDLALGERDIPRAVRALGAGPVRTVIISHPDLDHYSALLDCIEPLGVETVIVGEDFPARASRNPRGPAAYVLAELRARHITIRQVAEGDTLPLGAQTLTFLGPPPGIGDIWKIDNDHSLVAQIMISTNPPPPPPAGGVSRGPASDGEGVGGVRPIPNSSPLTVSPSHRITVSSPRTILLTGDIQQQAMDHIAAAHPHLHPDILELPHHGSSRPFAYPFVAALDPRIILQSTGPKRADDPRWSAIRAAPPPHDHHWYTTATQGESWAEIRRDGTLSSGTYLRGQDTIITPAAGSSHHRR
jgi:competence protein ComEC